MKYLHFLLIVFLATSCSDSDNPETPNEPTLTELTAFNKALLNFNNGAEQFIENQFQFPENNEKVEQILMYVKLECPEGGCGAWDVFANIKVKDKTTNSWLELGRYITPYGVSNLQRVGGFVFDVTDFKSLLQGTVSLKAFIEVWTAEGWELTVNFKIIEDQPKFKYSKVIALIDYSENSQQIPYGESIPDGIKLSGEVTIPNNTESANLRTIISGWGHATPNDDGGRGCAEWCFRTHQLIFDNTNFNHSMEPIGCESNSVNPQNGNWAPNRAGWCPGMEVPIRINELETNSGNTLTYQYNFEDWENNQGNGKAYYSVSTYLVLKSNTPFQ